jgi:hypothetical protein
MLREIVAAEEEDAGQLDLLKVGARSQKNGQKQKNGD